MSDSILWYIRQQDGLAKGPFSAAIINNKLSLRRLKINDEISEDQITWRSLATWPELRIDHNKNTHKQLDERDGFDRRNKQAPQITASKRSNAERRALEHNEDIRRRQFRTQLMQKFRQRKQSLFWPFFALISLGLIIVWYGVFYAQSLPSTRSMCDQPAAPYINWENCIKPKISLENKDLSYAQLRNSQLSESNLMNTTFKGADLSYADLHASNLNYSQLQNANLKGANLSGADLSYADLSDSDLSYADLSQANLGNSKLDNARFDHAIWIDGQKCKAPSIGQCR
jgi:uncharacterized protein YjbI with pentapeptide repeats